MLKFFRAASVAAVTFTLASAAITADAGFAFENNQSTALNATTTLVDAAQISADQVQADLAKRSPTMATSFSLQASANLRTPTIMKPSRLRRYPIWCANKTPTNR
jgi:hypothetical protein